MEDLFTTAAAERRAGLAPLAERMRPRSLAEVVGQPHLTGPQGAISRQVDAGHVPNAVLVGGPGSGKTTIARLMADAAGMALVELSAVACGLADVRAVIADADERLGAHGRQTVLFLDEIHRFNRAQQDALLPSVERGTIRLVGATTENPYVSINRALLSRLVVYELRTLGVDEQRALIEAARSDAERGVAAQRAVSITPDALDAIVDRSGGDARCALTLLEAAALVASGDEIGLEAVDSASTKRRISYDRAGDQHYDHASAYIKSMRAGNADDALLYLASMIEGGEDPLFIARRLVIFASEDVGNARPLALSVAMAALGATKEIGLPEARIPLAQATRLCAEAPKSRQAIDDIEAALASVREDGTPQVPPHLTNRTKRSH